MKKGIIIALCSLAVMFAACKKSVEPTPEPIDYTPNYVGNYIGQFMFTITSMNNQAQTGMSFPIEDIRMDITKGEKTNAITATVTVDNESHQTTGIASAEKIDFGTIPLSIDKPDQGYMFNLNLKMEGKKVDSDTLNVTGDFSGNGKFVFMGQENILEEVSGRMVGTLVKQ